MNLTKSTSEHVSRIKTIFPVIASIFFAGFMLFAITGVASATDYYVATSGNNVNQGTLSLPWQTLSYAMTKLQPGDTLYIADGTWNEPMIPPSGTATKRITIQAMNKGKVILSGSWTSGVDGLELDRSSYVTVRGIKVQNFWRGLHLGGSSSHHNEVYDSEFTGSDTEIVMIGSGAHDILLDNISVHTKRNGGLSGNTNNLLNIIGNTGTKMIHNVTIRNSKIYDNPSHNGINFGPDGSGSGPSSVNQLIFDNINIYNNIFEGPIYGTAVYTNWVRVNNLKFNNNIIRNTNDPYQVSAVDSVARGNAVYGSSNTGANRLIPEGTSTSSNYTIDKNYLEANNKL